MTSYMGLLPAGVLLVGALVLLVGGTFARLRAYVAGASVAIGLLSALLYGYIAWAFPKPQSIFFGMVWVGGVYSLLGLFAGVIAAIGLAFAARTLAEKPEGWEAFPLTLLLLVALSLLPASNHLLLAVVAVETVSLGSYVLVGLSWQNRLAPEAAVKYFLLSAVGFAILLFGLSYLYGLTGTLYLHHLWAVRWTAWHGHPLFSLAAAMIAIGLFFKLSVFPFHWWAPDVYGGATPSYAGLVVALGKLNAAFLGGLLLHYIEVPSSWLGAFAVIAAASSLYGNLSALGQTSLQRLLGYSSVAHGSYILLALVSGPEGRLQAWAYALVYGLMSVLAFGLIGLKPEPLNEKALRGLGYRHPAYALALALTLASLSGMPPLAGFFAKYGLFVAAFRAGHGLAALIALVGALIGYAYYWRPIAWLYQSGEGVTARAPVLALGALLLVVLGLLPSLLWGWLDYLYGIAGFFLPRP